MFKKRTLYAINTRKLDKVSVTKYLSYIHLANGPCILNLAYSKGYVYYMLLTCGMISLF